MRSAGAVLRAGSRRHHLDLASFLTTLDRYRSRTRRKKSRLWFSTVLFACRRRASRSDVQRVSGARLFSSSWSLTDRNQVRLQRPSSQGPLRQVLADVVGAALALVDARPAASTLLFRSTPLRPRLPRPATTALLLLTRATTIHVDSSFAPAFGKRRRVDFRCAFEIYEHSIVSASTNTCVSADSYHSTVSNRHAAAVPLHRAPLSHPRTSSSDDAVDARLYARRDRKSVV